MNISKWTFFVLAIVSTMMWLGIAFIYINIIGV